MAKGRALPSPVQLIRPRRHGDARGWFTEVYNRDTFAALGIDQVFVQDNHSLSAPAFTLRGHHFQTPPRGQDKLVRCIRGRTGTSRSTCGRGRLWPVGRHRTATSCSCP